MGSKQFHVRIFGKTAEDAYRLAVQQANLEHSFKCGGVMKQEEGCTGTIAESVGFVMLELPNDEKYDVLPFEALDWFTNRWCGATNSDRYEGVPEHLMDWVDRWYSICIDHNQPCLCIQDRDNLYKFHFIGFGRY